MKIYINNYKNNWISPYAVAEKLFFWRKSPKLETYQSKSYKDLDELFSDWEIQYPYPKWLEYVCGLFSKIAEFFNRKINYVKIDKWDTWNMDGTLALIILPMLKQLKETKHGAPTIDNEDVPWYLHSKFGNPTEQSYSDDLMSKRYDYVLDEMIWTFEQLQPTYDYSKVYHKTKPYDSGGHKLHEAHIENGLRLFGKYYRTLWD